MVVRVVQTEQPSAVQCESSEPGISNDQNLDVAAMSFLQTGLTLEQDFNVVRRDFSHQGIQV